MDASFSLRLFVTDSEVTYYYGWEKRSPQPEAKDRTWQSKFSLDLANLALWIVSKAVLYFSKKNFPFMPLTSEWNGDKTWKRVTVTLQLITQLAFDRHGDLWLLDDSRVHAWETNPRVRDMCVRLSFCWGQKLSISTRLICYYSDPHRQHSAS